VLSNTGSSPIAISGASVSGAGFAVQGNISVSIPVGQQQSFQMQFTPESSGSFTGTLTIRSNAQNASLNISLVGTGVNSPEITTPPVSETVMSGQTATFSVVAAGTEPLSYQWFQNGAAVSGATSSSYTTAATTTSETGTSFAVEVSNGDGNVISSAVTLTVNPLSGAPSITSSANATFTVGTAGSFAVTATGTPAPTISESGALPSGVAFSGGVLSGTPASGTAANYPITFTAGNGVLPNATQTFTLAVSAATFILSPSTTNVTFNNAVVGVTSSQNVTLTNGGNSNVTVSSVSVSGPGFNASGVSYGQVITPGNSGTLQVSFDPSATQPASGSVNVTSNASPISITLSGTGSEPAVVLTWNASASPSISGYNVYRGLSPTGPFSNVNTSLITSGLQYTDSTVQTGQTYYYVATAVNSSNVESGYSAPVTASIP
jgi:hypothetical protein